MSEAIDQWHAEHANFAQLLALLERQLARFHADEQPDYVLMLDVVEYLRHYPDRFHHAREDVAFERLVAHDPFRMPGPPGCQSVRASGRPGGGSLAHGSHITSRGSTARPPTRTS